MDENKINYSDLALRRGDSPTTINEKLLTEQTEHIFSEDQALEILSEFENNGIQAGMAKQLEILLANKEEHENAISENQDKKEIIVENDNPKPENIRGYDEAIAQSRKEIRKINEQIAALEKGLEEMNNTQNPEKDLPATEEKSPEEPQNPATPVTPQDEDTRVAEARPVKNNPEISQDEEPRVVKKQNEAPHVVPVRRVETRGINEIPSHVARNTEEKSPEEPQNPATPVTPQDEDTRVAEARPLENNPETTQDTTDSKEWKNNPSDYRTILREIEKSENELRELNSRRDALKAAQENMDKETYQREMSTIERFLAGEQLKLDQNRNLANNYEAAYSLLKYLDGLTGQPNNSRDAQDREAREEEITTKRKELASHLDELTDTLAAEVRNRVLSERANSERANRNNNVVGLTPEQIISRYAPFAEIYDNNEIKETDPQVLVAEAERQIREREAAKEETAHKVAVRKIKPNRVINVIPSHVAGVSEEPTPEPVITPPPTNLNNPADALHNSDAQSEYNEALQDFLKIFDEERNEIEEKGPFTTMEALNEFHDKYFALKEAANERLVNAKKRLEESRVKNAEQPRTTNTPNSSILALPAANKEKSPVLGLPPHVPKKSGIIDTYEGNPGPNMPKNPVLGLPPHKEPEKQKQPENNETKVKKGLYTIMAELTDGLELTRKMNGKYTASNIRVVKGFKEELKSGNVLYNIAHFATAVVAIPINFVRKVVDKLTYSMRERENVEKFKERLSKLSQEDLETIWNEYRGTRVIQERYAVIIDTLINERMQQYALEKVSAIRKDMSRKYKILFDSMKMVESYDKLLQTETDLKRISFIKQEREKVLAGKAEMISSLRSQYIEANQILSGGAHGVSEDMKAAKTKLTIAGKRFAKDHDFNNELAAKQAEIEKRENAAIAKGDNEAALRAFIDGETLLRGKTEIKNTIYGQRSVGEKYSMPLPQGLDYRDDPFVRDLLRTVAYVGMGISAANALITHGPKSDALLQQNKADTDRVNAANDATIEQVHQAGDTLTGNRDDFITGMQSQTGETSVNISQSLERETLDSNSWYLGTEYNKMDAFNHARYNAMSDAAKAKLEDIATKCYNNQITDMQALEMIKEVANTQHQNLIDIYTEYQPILEQYASTHPFDLHGVQESMQFVLDHPDAVIKMNEGMVESIQVGEELAGLSAEHIAAINSLPSDLATTLFGVATSTAALTYQAASTMNNNAKSGKYGNEITDMIQDYIDSKAKANEAAPEEKSSGSGKSR